MITLVTFKTLFVYIVSLSLCQWIKSSNKSNLSAKDNQDLHLVSIVPVLNTLFMIGVIFVSLKEIGNSLKTAAKLLGFKLRLSIVKEVIVEGLAFLLIVTILYLIVSYK